MDFTIILIIYFVLIVVASNSTNTNNINNPAVPSTSSSASPSSSSSSVLPQPSLATVSTATSGSSGTNNNSNSNNCASGSSGSSGHHSPYDLRKKSPSTNHENWGSGPSTSTASTSSTSTNNNQTSQTTISSTAATSSSCTSPSPSTSTSNATSATTSSSSTIAPASSSSSSSSASSASQSSQYQNNPGYDGTSSYMLPARKRPRRFYSASTDVSTHSAAHYLQYEMPDEVLLTIFSYLLEQDLCRLSLVCKRFQTIANDTELWKRLYQSVYEYDLPLFNPEPCKFIFVKQEDSEYINPWKESFRQLYRGIHVRPGFQDRSYKGRNISYYNSVQAALDYADEKNSTNNLNNNNNNPLNSGTNNNNNNNHSFLNSINSASSPINMDDNNCSNSSNNTNNNNESSGSLIFLHTGTYRGEFLVIDSDVALIGAASGNVAESIVLERESESTVMFVEGAKHAYVGHMTLKFSPDVTSTVQHHKHYCLEVGENCSPTIDHCIIRSTSVGEYI